ncbi:MAG: hypothetical protein P4L56_28710, partial [Candidatus Sulfopaludibacter sp.]|nr:hypothetical protein [Candidatus Sulfopaludibacter sp.]
MTTLMGRRWMLLAGLFAVRLAPAQTLTNHSLNGKFFFRQISLGTDGSGSITDPRSILGTLTFDGAGHFSFTGQQVNGTAAPVSQAGGPLTYSVDPAGNVSMDSPLRSGDKENARFGPEALIGSSTESSDNTFDLFVAIPAPAGAGSALSGPYWAATLEFPGGTSTNARNTLFSLTTAASGTLAAIAVNGHAANLNDGAPATQQVTGGTYAMNNDGSGTLLLGGDPTSALLTGTRNIYVSADGNLVIGGTLSAGSHDILIGVKAMTGVTNASWNVSSGQSFWAAGLRFNAADQAPVVGFTGSASPGGTGNLTWSKRLKALNQGNLDFTAVNGYSLNADGSGSVPSALMLAALGGQGNLFLLSSIDPNDPGAFEIDVGVRMPALSGTGVFLNPLGVVSAASYAPAGNPIAPGEFIAMYGTGLAKSQQVAAPPYPPALNFVSVQINGKTAPIYAVSPNVIFCLVPYAATGATAAITVSNNGAISNTVTVQLAPTAPGMFAISQNGTGPGAILHADYSLVNAASPAIGGETVLVYLTGMGAVTTAVSDGVGATAADNTVSQPVVLVGGLQGTVIYSGLAPGYPGLYQMNVTLPAFPPGQGTLPLAIST